MSITEKNSVLILGAGASAPFGLPLGGQLLEDLSKTLEVELSNLKPRKEYIQSMGAYKNVSTRPVNWIADNHIRKSDKKGVSTIPNIFDVMKDGYFDPQKCDYAVNESQRLLDALRNQTSETIDDFIVENPSLALLTKKAVCIQFINSLYNYNVERREFNLQNLAARNLGKQRNWAHLLINLIRQGIRNEVVSRENTVKIITFNYDCVLEHILDEQFNNSEFRKGEDWKEYIDIAHVHGAMTNLPHSFRNDLNAFEGWYQNLNVIHELHDELPEDVVSARQMARNWTSEADYIYACGFLFAASIAGCWGLKRRRVSPLAQVRRSQGQG